MLKDAIHTVAKLESLPKIVKWLWEPDDGGSRWVPYDALICQKLERHFQLWLFANTTTCRVCAARRATFCNAAAIESSFLHQFGPDVMWTFRFACQLGKSVHVQVLLDIYLAAPAILTALSTQENVQSGSRRGIVRDSHYIDPDNHAHPPGASIIHWAPDAIPLTDEKKMRRLFAPSVDVSG